MIQSLVMEAKDLDVSGRPDGSSLFAEGSLESQVRLEEAICREFAGNVNVVSRAELKPEA